MDIKQLQIGDFIIANGYNAKVSCIYGNIKSVIVNYCDWGFTGMFSVYELMPIPITMQILEKNGFSFEDSGDWIRYDGVNSPYQQYISIRLHRDLTVRHVEIKGMRYHCNYDDIRYVHELQRALRCCGLWELAENFQC